MSKVIAQQLRALADQLDTGGSVGGFVGPGLTVIDGAAINLAEPVAADWPPSMNARTMSQNGSIVGEPSNAPTGMPRRSPAGRPLHYPGVRWDGYGTPNGPAMVMWGDTLLADDAAVVAWRAQVAQRDATLARVGGTFSPGPR